MLVIFSWINNLLSSMYSMIGFALEKKDKIKILIWLFFYLLYRTTTFHIGGSLFPSITPLVQRRGGVSLDMKILSCTLLVFSAPNLWFVSMKACISFGTKDNILDNMFPWTYVALFRRLGAAIYVVWNQGKDLVSRECTFLYCIFLKISFTVQLICICVFLNNISCFTKT